MPKTATYAQWSLEPYCIGMKLRGLRNQKRLTLSRLGAETKLSTALLSKLETDRMIPTLSTLSTISKVYGVGLSYFFTEPERHSLSITRKGHLQGSVRGADPEKCIPLNSPTTKPRLVAQMIEMSPGGAPSIGQPGGETCRLVYVLEGQMELDAGGMHEILEAGDCVYIESLMPMTMSAAGKERCRILAVMPTTEANQL